MVQVWTPLRISRQDPLDEVSSRVRNVDVVRERIAVLADAPVSCLHVGRLERRFSNNERVDYDAQRPNIHLVRVAALALEYLGGDIVRRTANRALLLTIEVKLRGKAKITQFDLHFVVEEEVAKFEVTVDDSVRVKVLEGGNNLGCVALHLQFVESLTALEQLVHALVLAQFEKDVNILTVFEEVLEMTHIIVFDAAVNLYLAHQFLLGTTLGQTRLLDDLGRVDEGGIGIDEFVTLREATLPKKLAFEVATDSNLATLLLELFLYYGLCAWLLIITLLSLHDIHVFVYMCKCVYNFSAY